MVALGVLLRVHRAIFAGLAHGHPADVRAALQAERAHVLAGVRIVFSRVIPLEMEPQHHPLWQMAVAFGATCSNALDASVTHVVAGGSGTDKVAASLGAALAGRCPAAANAAGDAAASA